MHRLRFAVSQPPPLDEEILAIERAVVVVLECPRRTKPLNGALHDDPTGALASRRAMPVVALLRRLYAMEGLPLVATDDACAILCGGRRGLTSVTIRTMWEKNAVEAALDVLLSRGRIRERVGRTLMYETVESVRRLPRDTWMARIGGLNSFVENLTHATFGRLFRREPRAFARTVSFQVPPGAVNELDKLYEELLLPRLREITEQAEECESGEPMQLSLCWAPYEYLKEDKDDDQRGET